MTLEHLKSAKFNCEKCGKYCKNRKLLTSHKKSAQCKNAKNSDSEKLNQNLEIKTIKLITEEKLASIRSEIKSNNFQCIPCRKMYTRKDVLAKHMKRKHFYKKVIF